MIEICRRVTSEVLVFGEHSSHRRGQLLRWAAAFPVAVKNHLRSDTGRADELAGILPATDAAELFAARHQPLCCLHEMRRCAAAVAATSPLPPELAGALHRDVADSINVLNGAMGAMERINNTPVPYAYTAHVRAFLLLYLLAVVTIYAGLWGWMTLPSIALAAVLLLGVDAAAAESEQPFRRRPNHLPLERYCLAVADDVLQLVAAHRGPALTLSDGPPASDAQPPASAFVVKAAAAAAAPPGTALAGASAASGSAPPAPLEARPLPVPFRKLARPAATAPPSGFNGAAGPPRPPASGPPQLLHRSPVPFYLTTVAARPGGLADAPGAAAGLIFVPNGGRCEGWEPRLR